MNNSKKGKFFVFEGIDGCGKSTQAKKLKAWFENNKKTVFTTFEPTYGQTGTLLHQILSGEKKADPSVIAALFAADRLEHITHPEEGLKCRIEKGENVICDRYYFSSLAYQGSELDDAWIYALNSKAKQILKPDITIFLDISPQTAVERIKKGRDSFEIYENIEKLTAVREKYMDLFLRYGKDENIFITNGDRDAEEIFEDILKSLENI